MTVRWGEKRYYSLDYYLKTAYGEKLYKISLDGGMTCPNRDGTLGTRGCISAVAEVPVILHALMLTMQKNLYQINIQEIILLHTSSPIPIHMQMSAI